ncbi:MAG: translation initiation factor IF-2 subunit beta [Methanomassiliicoccales archaeon]
MAEEEYLALLDRAKQKLPEKIEKHERFTVPEPDVFQEGKTTMIRNFNEIADALRREPTHLLQFLLRELGAPGYIEGTRAVFKAKIADSQIADRIRDYTEAFVLCSECGRPDTHIVKEGRILILECEACGAHRPVSVKKTTKVEEKTALKDGDIIEVLIEDVGKKGDGIARLGNYIIYVPGTVKGIRTKVKINKVAGNVAFATVHIESGNR